MLTWGTVGALGLQVKLPSHEAWPVPVRSTSPQITAVASFSVGQSLRLLAIEGMAWAFQVGRPKNEEQI